MEDPLKPQLNYSEALAYLKDRQHSLEEREKDLAERHERLLLLEKGLDDTKAKAKGEVAELEKQIRTLNGEVAKASLLVENERIRLKDVQTPLEAKAAELSSQIKSLETSFSLNMGRNEELAKSIRAKEVELGDKRRELDELIRYHKEQESSVQVALEGYNEQLHACSARVADLQTEIAQLVDKEATLTIELENMTQFVDKKRLELETELTALEEQRDKTQTELDSVQNELDEAQKLLIKVQTTHDKTVEETEELIKKSLVERKATAESRAILKRIEGDVSDERRRLQSDRAIYGKL